MLMRLENRPPSAMFITCSGRKSGDERGAPIVATRSCVCGAPGLSTITIFALRRRGRSERGPRRRPALPAAERLLGQRAQLGHRDVAGHDERRVVRHEVLLPERHHVVAGDRLDRRLGADLGVAVRMPVAVERRRRDLRRDLRRVVALLHELPEPRGALALDLLGRERRPQRDVGHQVERRRRSSSASDRPLTVVASIELAVVSDAPSCATSSAICERVARGRAFVEHRGDEVGEPGLVERVGVAAGLEHEIGRHDRQLAAAR